MTKPSSAAREWTGVKRITHEWSEGGSGTTTFASDDLGHVIEFSAYKKQQKIIDVLRAALEHIDGGNHDSFGDAEVARKAIVLADRIKETE